MVNEIKEINCDTIRELRQRGLHSEANQVLEAYYLDKRKMKEQILKEIKRTAYLKSKKKKLIEL